MKRHHREGDWFGVPLGDGSFALGLIAEGNRNVLSGYFFGPPVHVLPQPGDIGVRTPQDALWSARVFDRALAHSRWPVLGAYRGFDPKDWPEPGGDASRPRAVEETLLALATGAAAPRRRRTVRNLRAPLDAHVLAALPLDARVQWRSARSPDELAALQAWLAQRPHASIRLYGDATAQAMQLARWPELHALAVDAASLESGGEAFAAVRALEIDGLPANLDAVLARFPALRSLSIEARGAALDAAALSAAPSLTRVSLASARIGDAAAIARLPNLRALALCDGSLDDPGAVLGAPHLRALRLARIAGVASIEAIAAHPQLRVLALEGLTHVDGVRVLATLERLESLELTGMWQLAVDDVKFVLDMPALRRLDLDIGGRRKNVELYKRRSFAHPRAFDDAAAEQSR